MPEQEQDMLEQALHNLESELKEFGKVQEELGNAQAQLKQAELQWNAEVGKQREATDSVIRSTKATADNMISAMRETTQKLVESTSDALATAKGVMERTDKMVEALIPLANSIKSVNFPMRLDKIDMAVSTQASATTNLQGITDKGFSGLRTAVATVDQKAASGFVEAAKAAVLANKKQKVVLALLVFNTVVIAGAVALAVLLKFKLLAF